MTPSPVSALRERIDKTVAGLVCGTTQNAAALYPVFDTALDRLCALAEAGARDSERAAYLEMALRDIQEGRGAFSRDQLTHAGNTIDGMKRTATEALTGTWESREPLPSGAAVPTTEGQS